MKRMANRKIKIESRQEYNAAMKKIDALMKLGETNLTGKQASELKALALAANSYEKSIYEIPAPQTLEGLLELEMYQRKMKQKEMARFLGIAESKFSEILNKKRPVDIAFLKAAHERLGIDGNILLRYA
jgi:HTH-type transcriptional regulator/antitoxin HigA